MHFNLLPFADNDRIESLHGNIELHRHHITCRWVLDGSIENIVLPARRTGLERTMSLWEHTCFEFFIGGADDSAYYEFNLSPSGQWNSFSFSDVRTDMAETPALACTASSATRYDDSRFVVAARLQFEPEPAASQYRVGISAVIEDRDGNRYYYALSHDDRRPDFHRRSNHSLLLQCGS